ncbi:hypothetical protein COHA_008540 [Chlorella ohadii]|uniref:Uncharacterized protein n=1 Tax=Chlorella ohadii TaxID=2649997 RepID=A0AAD5DNL1_9CHLO|nr:hypothetical protein COHA_008540 [Chlorella ohadii]
MSGSPRSVLPEAAEPGLRALVLGGGLAGLVSAAVACKHFDRVTLIEADSLAHADNAEQHAKHRRGIPQMRHPHTLVTGGLQAIESVLPGFKAEMVRRGAWDLDVGRDFQFFDFGAPFAHATESSLKSIGASRHLIQSTLQDEVLARHAGRLEVLDGWRVSNLVWSEDRGTVLGVELADGKRVEADLVIVTLGRYCRLPQWLEAGGYEAPPSQRVDCSLRYSSRLYQMPDGWAKDGPWLGHVTFGRPGGLRGAGMVPIEGNMWNMGLWGINGITPPTDEEGFQEYATSLPDQSVYQAIRNAKPLAPIHKYAGAFNIRHQYDKVQLPKGMVVLGDAYVALNPVYAQGMSVAAVSALTLDQALAAALAAAPAVGSAASGKVGDSSGSLEARRAAVRGMGPAFQKRLAAVVEAPWSIASSEDMRYPGTKVDGVATPPRWLGAYVDSLFRACHRDSRVQDIFFSVAHLTRPPHHLFHPHLLAAAAGQIVRDLKQRWWPTAAVAAAPTPADAVHAKAA